MADWRRAGVLLCLGRCGENIDRRSTATTSAATLGCFAVPSCSHLTFKTTSASIVLPPHLPTPVAFFRVVDPYIISLSSHPLPLP
ncbi:hypothetical protein BaRGS_00034756 [Batillaria attramentaria]|uniref:Secreted protein n=1 Tax=Batillaria attramentaria TaxID=370345 RepID=A0ABD0JHU6_9CAEN